MIKTLVTIGPASLNEISLQYFSKKTKLFRLNGSHSDLAWHQKAVEMIRNYCPDAFILLDIPGIKPRTANKENITIEKGQVVRFGGFPDSKGTIQVDLTKPLPKRSNKLKSFSVNDGQFLFEVVSSAAEHIEGISRERFTLLPKKGINLPGSVYNEEKQYEIYKDFINNVSSLEIDGLGLSFIQTGELVNNIREISPNLLLISKIENSEGLKNAEEIVDSSDGIMIDRGDLAAEVGFNRLFSSVEKITALTKSAGRPLIMATENLETMISRDLPSKSEVISLAHSASIGVDCIMLSEETALSENSMVIVDWLTNFLKDQDINKVDLKLLNIKSSSNKIWEAVTNLSDLPFVLLSKSGYAVHEFCSRLPNNELNVITKNQKLIKLFMLYRQRVNAIPPENTRSNVPSEILWATVSKNRSILFGDAEEIVAIFVSKYEKKSRANSIAILNSSDFPS